MTVAFWN